MQIKNNLCFLHTRLDPKHRSQPSKNSKSWPIRSPQPRR